MMRFARLFTVLIVLVCLSVTFAVPVFAAADITIDANIYTTFELTGHKAGPIWKSPTVGYIFSTDNLTDLKYSKTSDGGATWDGPVNIKTGTVTSFDVWADWQTVGDTGTKIHIAYYEGLDPEAVRYVYLDTSTDTIGGDDPIETCQGSGTFGLTTRVLRELSITKTRGSKIAVAIRYNDNAAAHFESFYESTDGDTWTSRASPWETANDYIQLLPANLADDDDLWGVFWDIDANEISLKTFDDSENSWSEVSIASSMTYDDEYLQFDAHIRQSDGNAIVAAWNLYDNAAADLMVWDITDNSTITAKTTIITNESESFLASVFINQINDDIYVVYVSGTVAGGSVTCFYQKSTDGGTTWDGETVMQADAEEDIRWVSAGAMKASLGGKFLPVWYDDDDLDMFCNFSNSLIMGDTAPTVVTNATNNVEETTATGNGNITDTGSENATIVYFEYDTDSGVPYANSTNESDDYGEGVFNVSLTGLTKGELYFGRAGAENSGGIGWGSEVSWIQKPDPASSFIVTDNNSDNISFSWTNGTGMDLVTLRYAEGSAPATINDGALGYTGTGTSCTVVGLLAETTYYARLFTQASEGGLTSTADSNPTASGTTDSAVIPTVIVEEVTVYEDTWAEVYGEIINTGGALCTSWGTQYGTLAGGVYTDNVTNTGSKGLGTWSDNVTGLTPGTAYIYRTFAINSAGAAYSDEGEYEEIVAPTVTVSAASSVQATTATINGNVTDTGGEDPTVTVYWGDNDGGSTPGSWDHSSAPTSPAQPQGVAAFYLNATSLPTGTIIYYSASAENSEGTDWATTGSFLTKPAAPTNVAATDGAHTDKVVVTWTKSNGAMGYKVYEGANLLNTLGDVATYDDNAAAAPTITAGNAVASDGTSSAYVVLSLSGTSASNGATRTYKVVAFNATGDSADSATNTGYRGYGTLTYQWQRSSGDSDADYSSLLGAITAVYNDTDAPENGDGRYYKCTLDATGAAQQVSLADRGNRDLPAVPADPSDAGSLLLRTLLRVVLAGCILIGAMQFKGVALMLASVIGLVTFVVIDTLLISLL